MKELGCFIFKSCQESNRHVSHALGWHLVDVVVNKNEKTGKQGWRMDMLTQIVPFASFFI